MTYSRRSRYSSRSRSPYYGSRSVSRSRSCSRGYDSSDAENPGNNLYVTGLSSRVTKKELEKHFANEGDVIDVHLVVDPWTRESRGFGFVTMATVEDANRCLKYLDRSVLEGRVISVEKARRRRGRTPTPGRYLGVRSAYERRRSPSYSPYHRGRSDSPGYSSERDYNQSSHSVARSPYSGSPVGRRHRRSYSPVDSRSCSPRDRSVSPSPYYRRKRYYRSVSCSVSPRGRRSSQRSYSRSISPRYRRSSRRSYSRSYSPRSSRKSLRRSYSRSYSPRPSKKSSKRSPSRSITPRGGRSRHSRESYSHSRSMSSRSRSVSRSPSRSY